MSHFEVKISISRLQKKKQKNKQLKCKRICTAV